MLAIPHSNDSFEDGSRSADIWAVFSRRRGRKLDFCPVSAVVKNLLTGLRFRSWSPKARFNESSGVCGGVGGHVG